VFRSASLKFPEKFMLWIIGTNGFRNRWTARELISIPGACSVLETVFGRKSVATAEAFAYSSFSAILVLNY
jgi:hypothetical protein